jgi:two-component system sensor histidine kinase BarA
LQKLSTRHRHLVFSLIPTLLLSTILGSSFLSLRLHDIEKSQISEGISTLNNFSYLVQASLNSAPGDSIQAIAYYILNHSNATSVTIYNDKQQVVAKAGPEMNPPNVEGNTLHYNTHHTTTISSLRLSTPLREDLLSPLSTTSKKSTVKNWGWIEIEIPSHATTVKRYQAFTLVLVIVLISWLLHLAIVFQRAHQLEMLINKFSQAFSALKAGNLKTSLRIDGSGDIGLLEAEFNSMAYALQQSQDELFKSMQLANDDITETLETIEIQNIELDLARKEAIKASATKSEFLANMSHEIRTPLNGIIGFTKLLAKSSLTPRQQEQLAIIQKSANGLLALINDILDFSKIEAGKLEIDQSTFNLREVIEEVADMLAPLAEEKQLELIPLYYSDTPTYMVGDPFRIRQIITNLMNNAIKFSNSGNIVIRTMLESDTSSSSLIKISVSDQGRGLSQNEQDSLFQAFNQLNHSKNASKDGTGLGLVISKHLTQLMGGEIGCISEQDRGATFWFTFRVRKDPMGDTPPSPVTFNDERIALYDENPTSRLAIAQQLQQLDIYYDEYESLDDFTSGIRNSLAKNSPYHAAIMSLSFSQEGSPIIPITIENIEKTLNCRVIVINHGQTQATFQALLDKSASAVLHKPLRFLQTLKTLQALLKRTSIIALEHNNPKQAKFKTPPRILAVDDTQTNLQLLCIFLGQLGADVTACDSGNKAVRLIEENNFDLVFMDYRMPDLDGLEATKIIRKKENIDQHLPIIGLTAHAMSDEKRLLLSAGMDDCITKPVDENQLYQIITTWTKPTLIGGHSSANTQHAQNTSAPTKENSPDINPIVDITESIQLVGGKTSLAREMFEKFVFSIKKDREKLLAQKNDLSALLDTVHSMHGAARYCGVPRLRIQAQTTETLLNTSPHEKEQIDFEIKALIHEIDSVVNWSNEHQAAAFE